ncbi:MAG: response regulator [Geobacteraceae bacterium]|jgi:PAS domain S-box-containing protein
MTGQDSGQRGPLNIIVVEDSAVDAELVVDALGEDGLTVNLRRVDEEAAFHAALDERLPDAILSDWTLPHFSGQRALEIVRERFPDVPFIFVSGTISESSAFEAMRKGANDYVYKHQLQKLGPTLLRAIHEARTLSSLRESEEKYRGLFEYTLDAIMTLEPPFWKLTSANPATVKMFGTKNEEEFISLGPCELSPDRQPDGRASVEKANEMIETAMREGAHFFEWTHRRIGGEEFPADVLLNRMEQRGKVLVQVTIRDITERKRAENALKCSEEFIRNILSSIDEAFVVIDREYQIVSANRAFCEQTGMPLADIIGKHCYEISHRLTRPCHEVDRNCACKRTFETGEASIFVYKLTDEECNQTHLETKTYAMKDEAGNVKSVIEIINDITEKTNLETQFRQAQKMEAVGTLAGGIAHDFNNILTAIIGFGYITLAKMGPDDPQRQNIENILEGADRAALLTKDLLIFSRKQVSEKGPVDLNEILGKVEKFLVRVIGEDINCSLALHNEPIVVYADPHQLEQVLMNLATNAKDSMAKSGDLIISAEQILVENDFVTIHGYGKPGRYALLTISDTGEGMDEATRKKIFDPFFTTKEVGKGTGLGLAVVYGIIKDHEGFINVYSEPGEGTTFRIYLPLISSEVRVEEIAPEKETLAKGTETILLTEDDESVRGLISIVLKQEGYTVIEAVDGLDAVKKFMENRETIHLLLSDLIMPKMNGIEAYDEMKVWRPGLKAIFASGYAPDIIRQKMSLESGVVLISKPILPYSLLKQVRSILDEGEK